MLVGYNLKGEDRVHHAIDVGTKCFKEAMAVVVDYVGADKVERCLVAIEGGKSTKKAA